MMLLLLLCVTVVIVAVVFALMIRGRCSAPRVFAVYVFLVCLLAFWLVLLMSRRVAAVVVVASSVTVVVDVAALSRHLVLLSLLLVLLLLLLSPRAGIDVGAARFCLCCCLVSAVAVVVFVSAVDVDAAVWLLSRRGAFLLLPSPRRLLSVAACVEFRCFVFCLLLLFLSLRCAAWSVVAAVAVVLLELMSRCVLLRRGVLFLVLSR